MFKPEQLTSQFHCHLSNRYSYSGHVFSLYCSAQYRHTYQFSMPNNMRLLRSRYRSGVYRVKMANHSPTVTLAPSLASRQSCGVFFHWVVINRQQALCNVAIKRPHRATTGKRWREEGRGRLPHGRIPSAREKIYECACWVTLFNCLCAAFPFPDPCVHRISLVLLLAPLCYSWC